MIYKNATVKSKALSNQHQIIENPPELQVEVKVKKSRRLNIEEVKEHILQQSN
jgi:hypothetical protein